MALIPLNAELEPVTDDYCSWEVSELLRKLGFNMTGVLNPYANMCYERNTELKLVIHTYQTDVSIKWTLAPTHAYACKWLMANFGVYISFISDSPLSHCCIVDARWDNSYDTFKLTSLRGSYPTPAEAMEGALLYILREL